MSANRMGKPIEILLVEDNPGDVFLTQAALEEAKINNNLHIAVDGEEAIAFLSQQGEYASSPRPDVILLDLNLPKKSGQEVLASIKNDEELEDIPVVILTTSTSDREILRKYNMRASCYITKPIDLEQFAHVVNTIENFWFTIVNIPH